MNMELIDTPNPNAKKLLASHSYEVFDWDLIIKDIKSIFDKL